MSKEFCKGIKVRTAAQYINICARFVSSEETRYYLNGINIRKAPTGIYIAATDGHRLGVFHDVDGVLEGKDDIIIPISKELREACRGSPRYSSGTKYFMFEDGVSCVVDAEDVVDVNPIGPLHSYVEYTDLIDGTFPAYGLFFPRSYGPQSKMEFNGQYAKEFGFGPEGSDHHGSGVAIYPGEDIYAPISVINPHFKNFHGVLMPLRLQTTNEPVQDWVKELKEIAEKKREESEKQNKPIAKTKKSK